MTAGTDGKTIDGMGMARINALIEKMRAVSYTHLPHQAKGAGTMKKQFDIKKLVLLNLPYLLMGLFATNFGEAWRLSQGANASEKFLSLFAVLPGAMQSFWPSLHPLDLLVGLC